MTFGRTSFCLALAGLLTASASLAAPPTRASAASKVASAPVVADPHVRRALRLSVAQHLTAAGLDGALGAYSLSPSLLQLRRYVDPGQNRTKFVCVVSLTVQNEQREVVADIRGTTATFGVSPLEAIDGAAHSAVLRLAETLAELNARGATKRWAQR